MGSPFYDFSLLQDQNLIGHLDRRDPMGNQEDGPIREFSGKPQQNFFLGIGVDAGKGVIENENSGIHQKSPTNSYSLLLASRQGNPPLSYEGLELTGKLLYIGPNVADFRAFLDGLRTCFRSPKSDVLLDGLREEKGFPGGNVANMGFSASPAEYR